MHAAAEGRSNMHMVDGDVIVVGAGPVGMLAALLSARRGAKVLLLERSAVRHRQSRAIGITPPSLEILDGIGLAGRFLEQGVRVAVSEAYGSKLRLGRIDFSRLKGDFPYVLSLPQDRIESLLESAVAEEASVRFLRGHGAMSCVDSGDRVVVTGRREDGGAFRFEGRYAFACDGGRSLVRESLGIPFEGTADRQTFLMADLEDPVDGERKALLHFTARGSVESFPLPGGRRRYILRTPTFMRADAAGYLEQELLHRAGVDVRGVPRHWESGFGVQRFLAGSFCKGRVFLCGDAAHLMSPVGGQNLNSGFADAELAAWLTAALLEGRTSEPAARRLYDRARRRAARTALRRARWLTLACTSGGRIWSPLRNAIVFCLFHSPARRVLMGWFSMESIPCRNLMHGQPGCEDGLRLHSADIRTPSLPETD